MRVPALYTSEGNREERCSVNALAEIERQRLIIRVSLHGGRQTDIETVTQTHRRINDTTYGPGQNKTRERQIVFDTRREEEEEDLKGMQTDIDGHTNRWIARHADEHTDR